MNKKEELRNMFKNQRKSGDYGLLNSVFLKKIQDFLPFKHAQNVMLFYPIKYEVNLLELLKFDKNYSFPCIRNDEIVPYINNNHFCTGKYKIQEPLDSQLQNIEELDLVIVPAICVDNNGNRIGYGKGYYDRFLKKLDRKRTKSLVVLPDDFVVEEIDADLFDEYVDFILTEKRIIEILK